MLRSEGGVADDGGQAERREHREQAGGQQVQRGEQRTQENGQEQQGHRRDHQPDAPQVRRGRVDRVSGHRRLAADLVPHPGRRGRAAAARSLRRARSRRRARSARSGQTGCPPQGWQPGPQRPHLTDRGGIERIGVINKREAQRAVRDHRIGRRHGDDRRADLERDTRLTPQGCLQPAHRR
jgi:hypothetical protein